VQTTSIFLELSYNRKTLEILYLKKQPSIGETLGATHSHQKAGENLKGR